MKAQPAASAETPDPLNAAAARFAAWRQASTGRRRIPAELWALATKLAANHGVSKVANRLKLDYYGLKRRLEGSAAPASGEAVAADPAFVELDLTDTSISTGCVLELADAHGRSLRIEMTGAGPAGVADLAGRLWQTCR